MIEAETCCRVRVHPAAQERRKSSAPLRKSAFHARQIPWQAAQLQVCSYSRREQAFAKNSHCSENANAPGFLAHSLKKNNPPQVPPGNHAQPHKRMKSAFCIVRFNRQFSRLELPGTDKFYFPHANSSGPHPHTQAMRCQTIASGEAEGPSVMPKTVQNRKPAAEANRRKRKPAVSGKAQRHKPSQKHKLSQGRSNTVPQQHSAAATRFRRVCLRQASACIRRRRAGLPTRLR